MSPTFVNDMVRLKRETDGLAPKRQGSPGRGKLAGVADWARRCGGEKRDNTLDELVVNLSTQHGWQGSAAGRLLHRLGLSHKALPAAEQRRPDVARARRIRITRRQPFMRKALDRLVFIDGEA